MPQLLVSVRSAAEARRALAGGAGLIDVKEPARGSLGRADESALAAVLDEVAGRTPVSAALGEIVDWADATPPLVNRLAYVKWGLAGSGPDWRTRLHQQRQLIESTCPCRVVIAAYADAGRAAAPAASEVCHFAIHSRAAAVLLDTHGKDGSHLLDWLSTSELADLSRMLSTGGVRLALAGGLGKREIESLLFLRPDWFAVRTAVCAGGERSGPVEEERVRQLAEVIRTGRRAG